MSPVATFQWADGPHDKTIDYFCHRSTPLIRWPEGSCSLDHYFSFWECVKAAKGWDKANVVSLFKKDKCGAWIIMAAWPWSLWNNGPATKDSINKELKEGKIINVHQQRCVDWLQRQNSPGLGSSSRQTWVISQRGLGGITLLPITRSGQWAMAGEVAYLHLDPAFWAASLWWSASLITPQPSQHPGQLSWWSPAYQWGV